jgi:hypothetical protein
MNAAKRFLTGAAVAAGALGIGAGVFFACRQELSPGGQSKAESAERRPSDAKYDDGVYNFYFKNGAHIEHDCDGYNSEPGGVTTIYEYTQAEVINWRNMLRAAGIEPEVYRTANWGKHCWVRFPTNLLIGVGWEGGGLNSNSDDEIDMLLANGKRLNFKDVHGLYYAGAEQKFGENGNKDKIKLIKEASKAQKDRKAPTVIIFFAYNKNESGKKAKSTLEGLGVPTIETGAIERDRQYYIIADASNISWFAYNQ